MNLPTQITFGRIVLAVAGVALLSATGIPYNFVISSVIFIVAALTDVLDGYLARSRNLITDFGALLDAVADKILMLLYFVYLQSYGIYPLWILQFVLAKEIVVNGFRSYLLTKDSDFISNMKAGKMKGVFQGASLIFALLYLCIHSGQVGNIIPEAEIIKDLAYFTMIIGFVMSFFVSPSTLRRFFRLLERSSSSE